MKSCNLCKDFIEFKGKPFCLVLEEEVLNPKLGCRNFPQLAREEEER